MMTSVARWDEAVKGALELDMTKGTSRGLARGASGRKNESETLASGAAYDRSVMVGLSTLGRFAACSAQFS
jgi:hypothetical protein